MMDILNITWDCGRGRMQVILDEFFPCTKKDLKKLLKIISLDWEHEAERKETLKSYFQKKKAEHEAAKDELNREKEKLRHHKISESSNLSYYISGHLEQHQKKAKWFSEYLKLL